MPFQSIVARARAVLAGLLRWVVEKTAGLRVRILAAVDRLLERIPQEKRRLAVMVTAGVLATAVLLVVGLSLAARGASSEQPPASTAPPQPQRGIIPPEDLFLPFEPDFVPGVMLERERREEWTEEDAAVLWQNPLINGEQEWRDLIEETVDKIMESVP
jgi:hypothetical protein